MAAGLGGGMAAPATLRAQAAWPGERPIQIIVPFPPGGGTDINIRAMVPFFEKHLPGARFVVVNRGGAGGPGNASHAGHAALRPAGRSPGPARGGRSRSD